MTAYEKFCELRDKRAHGAEAPMYTEEQAFSLAHAHVTDTGLPGLRERLHAVALYAAPTQPVQAELSDAQISAIVLDVAELPDRDSPEDQPEMMLVSADELRAILAAAKCSWPTTTKGITT